jgi:hypothetical protein
MYHRRLAHHLLRDAKSRRPERTQPHHRPNLPLRRNPHPRQMTSRLRQIHRQSSRRNYRTNRPLHAPQQSTTGSQGHRCHIRIPQKHPSIHSPHQSKKISRYVTTKVTISLPPRKPEISDIIRPASFEYTVTFSVPSYPFLSHRSPLRLPSFATNPAELQHTHTVNMSKGKSLYDKEEVRGS